MRRRQHSDRKGEFLMAAHRRDADEKLAAATDEYARLEAEADAARVSQDSKGAVKLAKKAIELAPQRPDAYYVLASAYADSGDDLRASECCYSVMKRNVPDSRPWAHAAFYAWDSRRRAAPCGTHNIFCGCVRCAALPEPPAWMATPEALVAMAERVVAAAPGDAMAWTMHAYAHRHMQSWPTALKSSAKAAKLFGDGGNELNKADMLRNAEKFREKAEAEAKAAAAAEAARMAGREAAANAAMEALLAEEAQEKAATARSGKGKVKKGKGRGRKK